ncbi:hypothetical protein SAMN05443634_106182 [Chishuiella changwenlii]|uniref:Microcystin-dependent protein n=1 Tax=Chishuiella changwenlii TaxID=1434701 RepID=A0A1M6YBR1_9FLAO|nr:hypothetical protein [Chishuiella changwenlii]GGE97765.1 hypothetical protein GCM10010984_14160 [Chishuiella changwenlii]SHL15747.1 hypothetical protein SAMN05443634_106182 [Chishuiella changwenlii]
MTKKQLPLLFLLIVSSANAQVKITDSKNNQINTNAILHLASENNNKGFLLPRLTLSNVNSPSPLTAHVSGMVVYNTATVTGVNGVQPSIYFNDGTKWIKLTTKSNRLGDLKNSFGTTDTNGWYLLNGRAISTLPTNARAVAQKMGFTTNLPNLTDSFLKNKSNSEAMNSINGNNSFTIVQGNLPNVSFTGTTSAVGDHTHTYLDNPATTIGTASGSGNPVANNANSNLTTQSDTHSHTISMPLGGSNAPVDYRPKSIATNIFIYLGTEA